MQAGASLKATKHRDATTAGKQKLDPPQDLKPLGEAVQAALDASLAGQSPYPSVFDALDPHASSRAPIMVQARQRINDEAQAQLNVLGLLAPLLREVAVGPLAAPAPRRRV